MLSFNEFQDKRICVALSGGADSVALLHYLKIRAAEFGYALFAVHCEHGIRGEESIEDMRFVEELCKAWDIPLFLFREDCIARAKADKESLETSARHFRRESFSSLITEGKIDYIATAHHQNDEAETVLFRMARGASLTGASAMKEKEGYFLRPFLGWSKQKICAYVQENGLRYKVDGTNFQTDATRNKIRLEVLPKLEEAVSGATENIARFAALAAEDDALLYRLSEALIEENAQGKIVLFSKEKPLFTRACLTVMKSICITKDYTSTHLNSLYALQDSERGARIDLPQGLQAVKGEKGLAFQLLNTEIYLPNTAEENFSEKGFDGGRYEVNVSKTPLLQENFGWKVLKIDGDKLPKGVVFRFRKEGDKMECFGGGRKSLKKFLNEKKIPVEERAHLPLIAEPASGEVYAVCGVEISRRVKVEEGSKNILYISIRKKEI